MSQTKTVELYTLSTCPWCKKAEAFLSDRGVEYTYIDYDLAEADVQRRIQVEMTTNHAPSFPFAKIGEDFIVGYNPDAYTRLLELDQVNAASAQGPDVEHVEPLDLADGAEGPENAPEESSREDAVEVASAPKEE
ncbi:MAG TPA: glutaredoxin family protein [Thermoleophilia bacterium]|nr:glutaredoxin family protein [Thermoleophilia bacterium]